MYWIGCIYQCKDTNFKANHNLFLERISNSLVVFTNAKILILKLITTPALKIISLKCCIYQCKDTNFKANHNHCYLHSRGLLVVFTNAKILILKLITTNIGQSTQRFCCIYQCKDTNFKANHNGDIKCVNNFRVVFTNAKILILKLITTQLPINSYLLCCIYQCKDTNFKANHNCPLIQ